MVVGVERHIVPGKRELARGTQWMEGAAGLQNVEGTRKGPDSQSVSTKLERIEHERESAAVRCARSRTT